MGGYTGGEIASSLAAESALVYIKNNFDQIEHNKEELQKLIRNAMEYANMIVYDKSRTEEQLDKIWDRFYRVDTARQRSQGGTGHGLAISKNILELHEVEYGVKNTEDGVLFYFYLPKKA